jgi:hypothetical protein
MKAKIACFCKESLEALEGYLRQKDPQEDILELTAECLSALSPEPGLESVLKVLGAVEKKTARKLLEKLRDLVPEEILDLMNQLAKELHSHALCLAALIILEPPSERAFEEAFSCFTELLSIVAHTEAIDLAEEVSERLSNSQLNKMNAVLGACSRVGGDRLDGLRLKEAYALLRDEQVDKAICLVDTLDISPRLEEELLRFYDKAGLSSRNVPILEQKFYAKLEEIKRDNPSLAETLCILHQLIKAELQSHKPEAVDDSLRSLRSELRDLHKQVAESREEAKRFIKQSQRAESANQQDLNDLKNEVAETKHFLQENREALNQLQRNTLPTYIYGFERGSDQLFRTNLVTGEQSSHKVPSYKFKNFFCWSEVPEGNLVITGGMDEYGSTVRDVVSIDVENFEFSALEGMLTPRRDHAALTHTQHVYVLGGHNGRRYLSECERYRWAEDHWEALPPLPTACIDMSGVVVENSLYALGGFDGTPLDLVQRLNLGSLTWELMRLRLPYAGFDIPYFKLRPTEVYLVVNKTLCSFTALEIRPLKTLAQDIRSWNGASYYHYGTLFCFGKWGQVDQHEIGSLSN